MAYDGFYSDLSTRGSANEILNLANQTKEELQLIAIQVESDAAQAAISANEAQEYAYQALRASQNAGAGTNTQSLGLYNGQSYGIVGGPLDMSAAILTGLEQVELDGGGILVCRAIDPQGVIKIDAAVNIESNNTTIIFESPVEFGPLGYVRFNGRLAELYRVGQVDAGKLTGDTYTDVEGRMVLPMTPLSVIYFQVGDRITLRGENDKNGAALQRQVTSIVAIDGLNVTCADEPEYVFSPVYPDSEWPADLTTGTTIIASVYSPMTGDSLTRTDTIQVVDNSPFTVGDLCFISDSRTEADFMLPEVSNLKSQANMEIYRLVGKDMNGTTNTLTFERELLRDYLTSYGAGVTKMDPVINSHIIANHKVTWPVPQFDRKVHSFASNYGSGCTIKIADAQGKTGKLGASARIAYSYNCHIYDSNCTDSYRFESAEGYGVTLYYSTFCSVRNSIIAGMRHNILLQTCTSCDVTDNVSSDDYISGIDLHGAASINCRIARNRVGRSRNFSPGVTNGGGIRNGNTSHLLGDHGTIIEHNIVEGYKTDNKAAGIDISPRSQGVIVRHNTLVDCWVGVRHYPVGSGVVTQQVSDLLIVDGNTFTRCEMPVDLQSRTNSVFTEVVFTNNKSINNLKNFELKNIPKVRAYNNEVIAPLAGDGTAYAFEFDTVGLLSAYGNICGATGRGIRLNTVTAGNVVRNFTQDVVNQTFAINVIASGAVILSLNGNESGGTDPNVGDPLTDFVAIYIAAKT